MAEAGGHRVAAGDDGGSPSSLEPYCVGMPMVMGNMQGFSREACVLLFFASWELTSVWRMWLAALLVFFLAVSYEKLRHVERGLYFPLSPSVLPGVNTAGQSSGQGEREARMLRALVHALSVGLGYFLMFVAMTFNPLLLIVELTGFAVGHYWFGLEPPPGGGGGGKGGRAEESRTVLEGLISVDPCCV